MPLLKFMAIVALVALPPRTALLGQFALPPVHHTTFHVEGTISGPPDFMELEIVPGIEVQFQSERSTRNVTADNKGFYQADLPLGLYTMTAKAPKSGPRGYDFLQEYVRPLFRVTSPGTLVLNGTLYMARTSCDALVRGDITPEQQVEERKDACGGVDLVPIPSDDGAPFQLYIKYPNRQPTDQGYVYSSGSIATAVVPVFVAYNLFTLAANKVSYVAQSRTIVATGNVVAVNGAGLTERADTMTFKVENGQALKVR